MALYPGRRPWRPGPGLPLRGEWRLLKPELGSVLVLVLVLVLGFAGFFEDENENEEEDEAAFGCKLRAARRGIEFA